MQVGRLYVVFEYTVTYSSLTCWTRAQIDSRSLVTRENSMSAAQIEGQRFGKLLVEARAGSDPYRNALWLCRCDCGEAREVTANNLRKGNTTSCGCSRKGTNTTHGRSGSPVYRAWLGMKTHGIKVCKRWENSFENFLADMGERPSSQYSIEP